MKGNLKKIFAGLLSVMMVLSTMPMGIFAEDVDIDGMLDIDLGDVEVQKVEQKDLKVADPSYPDTYSTSDGWQFKVDKDDDGEYRSILTGIVAGSNNPIKTENGTKYIEIPSAVQAKSGEAAATLSELTVIAIGDGTPLSNFSTIEKVTFSNSFGSLSDGYKIEIGNNAFANLENLRYFEVPTIAGIANHFTSIGGYKSGSTATNNVFAGCSKITFHGDGIGDVLGNIFKNYINACGLGDSIIPFDSEFITINADTDKWDSTNMQYTLPSNKTIKVLNGTVDNSITSDFIRISTDGSKQDCDIEVTAGSGATYDKAKGVIKPAGSVDNAVTTFTVTTKDGCNVSTTFTVKTVIDADPLDTTLFNYDVKSIKENGQDKYIARLSLTDNENVDRTEIEVPAQFKVGSGSSSRVYTVVSIQNYGFNHKDSDKIKKIILPETLTGYDNGNQFDPWNPIGENAFENCKNLKYINLPSNLKAENFISALDTEVGTEESPLYIHYDGNVNGLGNEAIKVANAIDAEAKGRVVTIPYCNAVESVTGEDTLFLDLGAKKTITVANLVKEGGYVAAIKGPEDITSGQETGLTVIPNEEADPNAEQFDASGSYTTGVITVAENGTITAKKAGSAQVCVMSTDGTRVKKLVNVYVSRMTTTTAAFTTQYWAQKNKQFKVEFPQKAKELATGTTKTYWSVLTSATGTKTSTLATVSTAGKLTCKKKVGTVYVKARLYDTAAKKDIAQATIKVSIKKPSFTPNKTKFNVKKGKAATITIKSTKQKPTTTAGGYKFTCKAANSKSKKYIGSIKVTTKSSGTTIKVTTKKKKGKAQVKVTGLGGVSKTITINIK